MGWQNTPRTPEPAWAQRGAEVHQASDFFSFRLMVTPLVIRVVYVLGAAFLTICSFVLFVQAGSSQTCGEIGCTGTPGIAYVIFGLITLTLGNLGWRVLCEQTVVFFSILDQLRAMNVSPADTMRLVGEGARLASVPADLSPQTQAQVSLRANETEVWRETDLQYGDSTDLETQAWRKPSAFTLIVTNQRVLIVRPRDVTTMEQQIIQDVPLTAVTQATARTIGPMRNLHIVHIEYVPPNLPGSAFGVRFDSKEAADETARWIRQAAGLSEAPKRQ